MTSEEIKEALRTHCHIRHRDIERDTAFVYNYATVARLTADRHGVLQISLELVTNDVVPCLVIAKADECEVVK